MSDSTSNDIDLFVKDFTYGVLASSEMMFSLSPEVGLYVIGPSSKLQSKPPAKYGQIPMIFYEVSATASGSGSWWLPTCSVPDTPSGLDIWGDWDELEVSEPSVIVTRAMLRPKNAWCWVPAGTVDESLIPVIFLGRVLGPHPSVDPT